MSCVDRARPTADNLTCASPRGSGRHTAIVGSTTYDSLADTVTDERCRTDDAVGGLILLANSTRFGVIR